MTTGIINPLLRSLNDLVLYILGQFVKIGTVPRDPHDEALEILRFLLSFFQGFDIDDIKLDMMAALHERSGSIGQAGAQPPIPHSNVIKNN